MTSITEERNNFAAKTQEVVSTSSSVAVWAESFGAEV